MKGSQGGLKKIKSANWLPYIGEKWGNISRNNCPALVFSLQVTILFPATTVQNAECQELCLKLKMYHNINKQNGTEHAKETKCFYCLS